MNDSPSPQASWGLSVAVVVAGMVTAGALFLTRATPPASPSQATSSPATPGVAGVEIEKVEVPVDDDDPVLGEIAAPTTLIIFSDFECPSCREFHHTVLPRLRQDFIETDQVRIVFKDFPLSQIHPRAEAAAKAAHCAHQQGKFWEYAHELFAVTAPFDETSFRASAERLGLSTELFTVCLKTNQTGEKVVRNVQQAVAAGITSTPAFVINGRLLEGVLSYEMLSQVLTQSP